MATEREIAGFQHKAIERANQHKNPFQSITEEYGKYSNDELSVTIKFFTSKEMPKDLQKFVFKLAERNVGGYYKSCSLGWQPKVKQNDMAKSWARFLIAYDEGKKPIGYTMFRFVSILDRDECLRRLTKLILNRIWITVVRLFTGKNFDSSHSTSSKPLMYF